MRMQAGGRLSRLQQEAGCLTPGLTTQEVIAQDGAELTQAILEERLERLADLAVKLLPAWAQQALVGDVLGQGVLEDVFDLGLPRSLPDQLLSGEQGEVVIQTCCAFGQLQQH